MQVHTPGKYPAKNLSLEKISTEAKEYIQTYTVKFLPRSLHLLNINPQKAKATKTKLATIKTSASCHVAKKYFVCSVCRTNKGTSAAVKYISSYLYHVQHSSMAKKALVHVYVSINDVFFLFLFFLAYAIAEYLYKM